MPILKPTFSLRIGNLQSTTSNPVAGPTRLLVEREMDIPTDALTLHLMERRDVALGDAVSLKLGHDDTEETVFTGAVVRLRPTLTGVQVQAISPMQSLLNLHKAISYEDKTAGSIANALIDDAGLTAGTVDAGPVLPRYVIDPQISAFWHLKRLAERLGYELYGDRQGHIHFRALGDAANLDAAVGGLLEAAAGAAVSGAGALLGGGSTGYTFGKHLLAAGAWQQPPVWKAVTVGGESPMSGQGDTTAHWLTTEDADYQGFGGDGTPQQLILDPVARTKDLADRFAAGQLAVVQRQKHQVQISVLGRPQLELGDTLSIRDVPDTLIRGSGYIRAIRHRFSDTEGFVSDLRIAVGGEA